MKNLRSPQWQLILKTTKLARAREDAGDQVAIDFSFASDWLRESGASFLNQSQSEVKQKQSNPRLLLTLDRKLLYLACDSHMTK